MPFLKIKRSELTSPQLAIRMNIPAIIMIFGFIAYPLAFALFMSFHRVSMIELRTGEMPFYGFKNYINLINDRVFWISIINTLKFVGSAVILQILFGLGMALVLNRTRGRLNTITKVLMLAPWAVPPIVNAAIWKFIFNYRFGIANAFLYNLGFIDSYMSYLGKPELTLYFIVFAYVWRTTPFTVLLLHASMQTIPKDLYEAAEVDGANAFQLFWRITLPLIVPTLVICSILRTTWAFQAFAEIFGMTAGGPGYSTWVASYYSYRYAFKAPLDMGIGAASAFVLALMIGIFAFLYLRILQKYQTRW